MKARKAIGLYFSSSNYGNRQFDARFNAKRFERSTMDAENKGCGPLRRQAASR
jgi:hypothetical protein